MAARRGRILRAETPSPTSETLGFANEEVLVVSDSKSAPADRLGVLEQQASPDEALAFFDACGPVRIEELRGCWKGSGLPTGHPFDGLLEAFGWHGKRFESPEETHPLVFEGARGLFSANPALVPVSLGVRFNRLVRTRPIRVIGRRLVRMARTSKPRARLRMVEYRGVVTATMSYDALPINDHFRRVDADTVIGVMDFRRIDRPFLFVLRREPCGDSRQ
jgi:Domain of unknown function (DUF4334)/GXWXG protein